MDANKDKITRFLNDKVMSKSVYDVLLDSFLTPPAPSSSVYELAAARIAINLLNDAWKKLERMKNEHDAKSDDAKQIGL